MGFTQTQFIDRVVDIPSCKTEPFIQRGTCHSERADFRSPSPGDDQVFGLACYSFELANVAASPNFLFHGRRPETHLSLNWRWDRRWDRALKLDEAANVDLGVRFLHLKMEVALWPFMRVPEIVQMRMTAQNWNNVGKYGAHCELFFFLMKQLASRWRGAGLASWSVCYMRTVESRGSEPQGSKTKGHSV